MRFLALAAAAVLLALPSTGCTAPASPKETAADKAFGEKVRGYLLAHPEVVEEAMAKLQTAKAEQSAAALKTALNDHRQALEHDPRDYVAGNPNGKVTIVEFFDYRCPFCKTSAPAIFKYLDQHKDVRLVLKEYPILSDVSEHAAHAALGAKASGKYLPVHQQFLAEKSLDDAAIDRVLKANGLDPIATRKAGAAQAATQQVADTRQLGRTLVVDGTPSFIIGDKMIPGWIEADISAAVADARKGAGG